VAAGKTGGGEGATAMRTGRLFFFSRVERRHAADWRIGFGGAVGL